MSEGISIIIPTMFKCKVLFQFLKHFNDTCDPDDEVILINNTNMDIPISCRNLTVIKEGQNTFVNPAWNKGVRLSKNELVVLLNDDIFFRWQHYKQAVVNLMDSTVSCIGLDTRYLYVSDNYHEMIEKTNEDRYSYAELKFGENIPYGFGCCMTLKKSEYIPVPDFLKVFFGDVFIKWNADNNKKRSLVLSIPICGYMSKTSQNHWKLLGHHEATLYSQYTKNQDVYLDIQHTKNLSWRE